MKSSELFSHMILNATDFPELKTNNEGCSAATIVTFKK